MSVGVKICGLKDAAAVEAVVAGGARYAGFVFYPRSPRAVTAAEVAPLLDLLPAPVRSVGLFVDPSDAELREVLLHAPLQIIQLHGGESPERVREVKALTGLPVMKAIGIGTAEDIGKAHSYEAVADLLLLDAKPATGGLPGGNARVFDWNLLQNAVFSKPWLLAGGLDADNVATAVHKTGARLVDVSSGVEDGIGLKSPEKIRVFLEKARQIETCY